jgi:hypothetical protein
MLELTCVESPDDYLSFEQDYDGAYYVELKEASFVCGVYLNKDQLKTLRDWIDMEINNKDEFELLDM